jgi:dTDP-4-amino-4,6-dideoxygalactose transaminase
MQTMSPWPWYAPDERAAADSVLESGKVNYWTGQEGRSFEKEYCNYLDVKFGVALANGTMALELPLRMWGVGPGDDVVVTPRSFIASVSCVVLQGARPVFADVDRDSGNITADSVAKVLTPNTRAIIPVHLGGWPCAMDPIMSLAEERGIKVLEDCAQAHGARYRGSAVGSIGHAAAFSFCQDKIISTGGEGGLLATNDSELWERSWSFKDHGKTWEAVYDRQHGPGFRWVHDRFGTNWRLTEPQAAIGRRQLTKLNHWVEIRRRHANLITERLGNLPVLRIPVVPSEVTHSRYKFYAYVCPDRLKQSWSRDRIVATANERGVPLFSGSCSEIYRERAFTGTEWVPAERMPIARELGETSVMFLVHPTLTETYLNHVCDIVHDVLVEASAP